MTDATKLADEIEALAAKATPGPWRSKAVVNKSGDVLRDEITRADENGGVIWDCENEHDAPFIVALANNLHTILAALRERDALAAEVERLKRERLICDKRIRNQRRRLIEMEGFHWGGNHLRTIRNYCRLLKWRNRERVELAAYKAMAGKVIETWHERCEKHPDHEGIVTHRMIQDRMQEEIDDLRNLFSRYQAMKDQADERT